MDESRKAFEQWALEVMQFTPDDLTWDERRNCYRDCAPHMAWKGWQASRAAIEIIVPEVEKWRSVDAVRAQATYKSCITAELSAAGIKVKE